MHPSQPMPYSKAKTELHFSLMTLSSWQTCPSFPCSCLSFALRANMSLFTPQRATWDGTKMKWGGISISLTSEEKYLLLCPPCVSHQGENEENMVVNIAFPLSDLHVCSRNNTSFRPCALTPLFPLLRPQPPPQPAPVPSVAHMLQHTPMSPTLQRKQSPQSTSEGQLSAGASSGFHRNGRRSSLSIRWSRLNLWRYLGKGERGCWNAKMIETKKPDLTTLTGTDFFLND